MSQAAQSSDPYYANEEIEILHEIITDAQEAIDRAKDPKPLPVQALFKAYDRILPQHGIDPDSDHHLSAFIFRVGGERGDLSLLGKFHTILERMGIVLEFGEGDTGSAVSAHSNAAFDQPVTHPDEADRPSTGDESALVSVSAHSLDSHLSKTGPTTHDQNVQEKGSSPRTRKTALLSALNRWSNASAKGRANGHHLLPPGTTGPPSRQPSASLASSHGVENEVQRTADQVSIRSPSPFPQHVLEELGEDASPVTPRPSIIPILDRLGLLPNRLQESQLHRSALSSQISEPLSFRDSRQALSRGLGEEKAQQPGVVPDGLITHRSLRDDTVRASESPKQRTASPRSEPSIQPPQSQSPAQHPNDQVIPETPYQQQGPQRPQSSEVDLENERLLQLACRAREIFIASKAFNHWADKTARRLEREAVARRHMIRFKCFRGWCQGPSAQDDEAHRLRATTAVQKLRRAVAEHEEQLRLAALAASESRRARTIVGALDRWMRQKAESDARLRIAQRSRVKAATGWLTKANEHRGAEEHATEQHKLHSENKVAADWHRQADIGAMRNAAAKKIGDHRASFAYLAQWWDQAELQTRANSYRRGTLLESARHYFEQWNLQARRQAFIWRNEFVSVRKAFEMWQRSAQEDCRLHTWANRISETRLKVKYSSIIVDADTQRQQLEHLSNRACLYICGTRTLALFGQTVERRQAQRWAAVKRHLSIRYEQVSTARKRRTFFSTLDTWRNAASVGQDQFDRARQIYEARESTARASVLMTWLDASARAERRYYEAQLHHTLSTLNAWSSWSQDQEETRVQALDMITTGKRIQYQKLWSISSLQHGGLAHTASMVAQRYQRDQRNRALQYWRQHNNKGKAPDMGFPSQRKDRFGASEGSRSAFRFPAQRNMLRGGLDGRRQSTGTFETPTRWTGQPLPMGSLFANRPMPPVREAVEEHSPASSQLGDDDDDVLRSPLRPMRSVRIAAPPRPSTTPMAPVPMHVEEEFRAQLRPATSRISGLGTMPEEQETLFGASQPRRQGRETSTGGRGLEESTSTPRVAHSRGHSALGGPATTLTRGPTASSLRISRLADTSRPTPRPPGSQSITGTTSTVPKGNMFLGASRNRKVNLSRSMNSRLQ